MSTQSTGDILAAQKARFKTHKQSLAEQITIPQPADLQIKTPFLMKPKAPTWDDVVEQLTPIVNYPGLWITIQERFDAGYGAELLTVAEIAKERHTKERPNNYFAAAVSKTSNKWETITLQKVHETWEIRRNSQEVIDRLKLEPRVYMKVLALAWKLKSSIVRFLGLATEQGTGIKNPAGVFFKLAGAAAQTAP
jgi:hypothetical protein